MLVQRCIPCEPLPPRIGVINDEIESTISNCTWFSTFCSRTNSYLLLGKWEVHQKKKIDRKYPQWHMN